MRKRTILLLLSVALVASVLASPVDPQRAIQVAQQFVPKSHTVQRAPIRGAKTESTSSIVYTHMMLESDRAAFYIINVDDAFVIVSADDVAHQILGYNTGQKWPVSKDGTIELPEHIKGFFDDLALQIETATKAKSNSLPDADWTASRTAQRSPLRGASNLPDSVGPLLTTHWDQGQYYNALCPEDINGPDGHVQNGCVATAMAQIIKYWGDSVQIRLRGTHSYDNNYGTLAVDFGNESYDFANMPNKLTAESSPTQVAAVAKLMYHCGVATNMSYGATESSAFDVDARAGLINFYRFSPDLSYAEKAFFNDDDWNSLLRENIAASRPIIYSGHGVGDHSFILDGYKNDDYYHFNFGWGGFADGWYLTDAVNPGALNFSSRQTALVGIVPDNTGNVILGQTTGTSTFTVDEPLEFYHLLGHNTYEGSFYNNPCNNTITFLSNDDTKQLVADILEFEDQNIRIHNGTNTNNELRSLVGGSENNLSPVESTANAITINYTGNMYYAGFKLSISKDNGYRMVSNIVSSVEATTVHLTWTENGSEAQWQVEYGKKGFSHGKGTLETVDNNTITVENLQKFTEYVFYIRSVGANNQYGPWNQKTIMVEAPYWQDVVTNQPNSYTITDNHAIISCAEDLVWFMKEGYHSHNDAELITDIDLSAYKWKPYYDFVNYTITGNGHKVSNLYISEINSHTAFIPYFSGVLRDFGIEKAQVSGREGTSVLIGELNGIASVVNCHVSNSKVNGTDMVAGIAAYCYGVIQNSYVNINVSGNRWTGLMTGYSQGVITNCYAAGAIRLRSFCYSAGICAYAVNGTINNCYSIDLSMGVVGYKGETIIADTSSFYRNDTQWILCSPINFEEGAETDLLSALNKGVVLKNDGALRIWIPDAENNGLPKIGNYYVVQYPNVDNLTVQNFKQGNNLGVILDWEEAGEAVTWEIKYQPKDTPSESSVIVPVNTKPYTLNNLQQGKEYIFSVRSVCDANHSGWTSITEMVDLPFWTDIVTEQPEGYVEDGNGNVTISSPEGLAWLSAVVNGLHGNIAKTFDGKTISLTTDIDLQGYRWFPIGRGRYANPQYNTSFNGIFDGNNHTISNLYVNSYGPHLGLFGYVGFGTDNTVISNTKIASGSVNCYYNDNTDGGFGGLIGSGVEIKEIINCSSNVVVYGNEATASLCGYLFDQEGEPTTISNCYATGDVYGRESAAGLIGDARGVIIQNCYSTGNIFLKEGNSRKKYRGGLIGNLMSNAVVRNCYSTGTVEMGDGKVIGCPYANSHTQYVYGLLDDELPLTGPSNDVIIDTSSFINENGQQLLVSPITTDGDSYDNLLDVLNAWVAKTNDPMLKTWAVDASNENGGYPVFGNNFVPSCYNPTNVSIANATFKDDDIIRTRIEWEQEGSASSWEVLYVATQQSIEQGTIIAVNSNPCELTNLPVGEVLDIYVRAKNDKEEVSGWSKSVTYIPDKLHWTEIVTSKPEGFHDDGNGNVYISSAEGLAWLSSVVNGLNGNNGSSSITNIYLTSDIDLSAYRWTTMETLNGFVFEGNNHTINGLYCNEYANHQGLFGDIDYCTIRNLRINNSTIYGLVSNGTIAGEAGGLIVNCIVNGEIYGVMWTGGLVGRSNGRIINVFNSAFIGMADTRREIIVPNCYNGFISGITGEQYGAKIINTYVAAKIPSSAYSGIVAGSGNGLFSNIYALSYPTDLNITCDNLEENSSLFTGSGSTWTFNTPPYINGAFHSDLVDALNAWIDANNLASIYRHWVADTANVNGGYPIFAPLPNSIVTFQNFDGTIMQTDTLEYGSLPVFRGNTPVKESTAQYSYTFKGWTPVIVPATENAVYIATYDSIINKYVISFCNENDTVLQTDTLEYDAMPSYRGDTPVKESTALYTYSFSGWSPEITSVTSNATYTAVFNAVGRIYGDVTGNRIVDIQDATIVVNYILGERSDNYLYYMADMNNDEEIDIFDLTAIINVILGKPNFLSPMRASGGAFGSSSYLATANTAIPENCLENVYLKALSDKVCLNIDETQRFTSFQMDVEVPDGSELLNVEVPGSKKTHSVQKSKIGDNLYRVIGLSMTSQLLTEENGELVNFQITNTANMGVAVKNIMFVTPKGEAHYFNESSTMTPTLLNNVSADKDEQIYDLSGRRINKKPNELEKGIYIINKEKVVIK